MNLDEIGRIQQRAASVIVNLTPRLAKGNMAPGGTLMPPMPTPIGPDGNPLPQPDAPIHLVMGNSAIGTFLPGEEDKANKLLAAIEKHCASARKVVEDDAATDLRKAIE